MMDRFDAFKPLGFRIIENSYVPEFTYKKVKRTWKERLLTRPFNPFKTHKEVVDGRFLMRCDIGFVCHPSTAIIIRAQVQS